MSGFFSNRMALWRTRRVYGVWLRKGGEGPFGKRESMECIQLIFIGQDKRPICVHTFQKYLTILLFRIRH